jgi:S-adenosylmethionine uptake transporter
VNRVAQQPVLAFVVALAAIGVLSAMDAVMKGLVIAIGLFATALWRSLIGAATGALIYLPRRRGWPSRGTLRLHIGRGVLITVMGLLFFWGLGRTPMAQAIALTFISPLIALGLAAVILGEKVGARSIGGSLTAFAGVLVILFGQAQADLGRDALLGSVAILASALCYALNIVMMRQQAVKAKPLEITFFQNLTIAVLLVAAVPLVGLPDFPAGHVWQIVAASLMSTAGVLLFAFAYARGEASHLAVTEYSGFLWAAALGWLMFGEPLSPYTLAGAVLIIAGCLYASRKKRGRRDLPEMEALA